MKLDPAPRVTSMKLFFITLLFCSILVSCSRTTQNSKNKTEQIIASQSIPTFKSAAISENLHELSTNQDSYSLSYETLSVTLSLKNPVSMTIIDNTGEIFQTNFHSMWSPHRLAIGMVEGIFSVVLLGYWSDGYSPYVFLKSGKSFSLNEYASSLLYKISGNNYTYAIYDYSNDGNLEYLNFSGKSLSMYKIETSLNTPRLKYEIITNLPNEYTMPYYFEVVKVESNGISVNFMDFSDPKNAVKSKIYCHFE